MRTRAQSTIEFTFAMVMVVLLIYGLIKTFRWVGMDFAQEAYMHEQANTFVHPFNCAPWALDCFSQTVEDNHRPQRLRAVTRNF